MMVHLYELVDFAYFDIENTGETWKATINKGTTIN